ncbi:MAG: transposase, partial [Lachnospiraceae bacterium]|nr:transposase [Lachnospiraceae bacterium]
MAKADNALQEYWDDEEKFADLFNAKLFGGEKVILPEHLTEADSRSTTTIINKTGKKSGTTSMYRDLIKVAKICQEYGVELVILGLEN